MLEEKLSVKKQDTQDVPNICALNIDDVFIEVHKKALKQIKKSKDCIINNSAIEGTGSNLEFYGPGKHLIAALPASGNNISKKTALQAIIEYVQWFAGPDVSTKITEKDLNGIDGESESPANESVVFDFPSFKKYLLLEDGEEPPKEEKSDEKSADSSKDADKDKNKDSDKDKDKNKDSGKDKDKDKNDETAAGWYICYTIDVEGQKFHPFTEVFSKFAKKIAKTFLNIGIRISSFRGSGGEFGFTLNDIKNSLEKVFGSIDPEKLKSNFLTNMKPYPQARPQVEIFDQPTILRHLKGKLDPKKDLPLVKSSDLSFCVKIHRNDKSRRVIDKKLIAKVITHSIEGIVGTLKNGVNQDKIVLINGYSENDTSKDKPSKQLKPNTNDDVALKEAEQIYNVQSLTEEDSPKSDSDMSKEDLQQKMQDYFQNQVDSQFKDAEKKEAKIQSSKDIVDKLLRPNGANDESAFNKIQQHENAFSLELVVDKPKDTPEPAKESMQVLHANLSLLKLLFESISIENDDSGESIPKSIQTKIEKLFKNLVNNKTFLDAAEKKEAEDDQIFAFNVSSTKAESIKSTRSLYNMLFEDDLALQNILFEGRAEEQKDVRAEIDRIGAKNLTSNVKELRKNYLEHLAKVKQENKDNKYVQDIQVNSKNWINVGFISKLQTGMEDATTKQINKMLDDCVSERVGKTDDKKYELQALVSALKKLPDGEKTDEDNDAEKIKFIFKVPKDPENPDDLKQLGDAVEVDKGTKPDVPKPPKYDGYEFDKWDPDPSTLEDPQPEQDIVAKYKKTDGSDDGDGDDEITITFKDIDDPSELSSPDKLSDDDKKKYKTIGEPLKIVPGEDVKLPEVKNKGKWEFMGFEPDPEDMDKTGDTYAMYEKNGPDTVKINFYETDPEKNEKTGDPIKTIEIEEGKPVNSTDEGQEAFEELNKKFDDDSKKGFIRKGWNKDPATKAEEGLEFFPNYIDEKDKDKEYTVLFQYTPDPSKEDEVEEIDDDLATQKVKAGEPAKAPTPPEIDGWKFDKWSDDFSAVNDDMTIIAKYKNDNPVQFIFKVPKDPENPDDLKELGDPIDYEEGKDIKPPEPPKYDGYEFDKWDPDPSTIKDPTETQEIVGKYKKLTEDELKLHTIFVMPDYGGILDEKDKIKITFKLPKLDSSDVSKTDPTKTEQVGDPIEVTKGTPIEVDQKTGALSQDGKQLEGAPVPPNLSDAGFTFDKWEPDIKKGFDADTTVTPIYKKTKNTYNVKATDGYDFYIVPMKGLKYKDKDDEQTK